MKKKPCLGHSSTHTARQSRGKCKVCTSAVNSKSVLSSHWLVTFHRKAVSKDPSHSKKKKKPPLFHQTKRGRKKKKSNHVCTMAKLINVGEAIAHAGILEITVNISTVQCCI